MKTLALIGTLGELHKTIREDDDCKKANNDCNSHEITKDEF